MTIPDQGGVRWRKSSYSSGQGGNCVEVAHPGAIRDSKCPDGPVLLVDVSSLIALAKGVRFNG
ncbi:MAG TPA: DUF397 domain-containing protein [Pseudonocardiaceae bacterium]|jgi:hypothetical protein|nr:DUF397 domain-containing protein [Pseudonocardiaceae bacterium]